jgi:hypothetical protein
MLQRHHGRDDGRDNRGRRFASVGISDCTSADLGSTYLVPEELSRFPNPRCRRRLKELCGDVVLMLEHRGEGVFMLLTCPVSRGRCGPESPGRKGYVQVSSRKEGLTKKKESATYQDSDHDAHSIYQQPEDRIDRSP